MLRMILNSIVLFFILFEFPLIGFITSRKLALIYCIWYSLLRVKAVEVIFKQGKKARLIVAIALLLCCALIAQWNSAGIYILSHNYYIEAYYYIYIILYCLIFPIFLSIAFKDFKEFTFSYVLIMIAQSFVVFVAAGDSSFRLFIYDNFSTSDGRFDSTVYWGTRIVGVYLDSSFGSITLCLACILLIYLRLNQQVSRILFALCFAILTAATFLIGRTGFYIELLLIIVYIILEKDFGSKILVGVCIVALGLVTLNLVLSSVNNDISTRLISWATELFNPETRTDTVDNLSSMSVPPFSSQLIIGTNVSRGVLPDGSVMSSDSGYAKTYTCIGVIGFMLYYTSLILLLTTWMPRFRKSNYLLMVILIVIAIVIEIKEPYFMKYNYVIVLITISIFLSKVKNININCKINNVSKLNV